MREVTTDCVIAGMIPGRISDTIAFTFVARLVSFAAGFGKFGLIVPPGSADAVAETLFVFLGGLLSNRHL